jgi:hypothetical protein
MGLLCVRIRPWHRVDISVYRTNTDQSSATAPSEQNVSHGLKFRHGSVGVTLGGVTFVVVIHGAPEF